MIECVAHMSYETSDNHNMSHTLYHLEISLTSRTSFGYHELDSLTMSTAEVRCWLLCDTSNKISIISISFEYHELSSFGYHELDSVMMSTAKVWCWILCDTWTMISILSISSESYELSFIWVPRTWFFDDERCGVRCWLLCDTWTMISISFEYHELSSFRYHELDSLMMSAAEVRCWLLCDTSTMISVIPRRFEWSQLAECHLNITNSCHVNDTLYM